MRCRPRQRQHQATATVLAALTVTGASDLQFGNVTPGVNKTVAIADAGAGRFDITKAATSGVALRSPCRRT